MKEKKGKVIALIIAVIVLLLAILIIPIVRKAVILQTIYNKTAKLEETKNNVYAKIDNGENTSELYFLDNKQKILLDGKQLGDILIATDDNPEPGFSDIFKTEISLTFWQACLRAKDAKIKTIEMEGKKYYEITQKYNTDGNTSLPYQAIKYVEKDTGLETKEIRFTEEKTYTIMRKYEFGTVTEADFTEQE